MPDGSGPGGFGNTVLGVERSLSGRAWRLRPAAESDIDGHRRRTGLSEVLARALASRGVGEGGAEAYLNPTLKALFPNPSCFLDMDRAAEILVDAVQHGRRTVVFADYDVDGATSAALLVRWFRAMGAALDVYVPDRMLEGYGPSPAAFRRLKADGAELVITVDCGAAAHDALEAAADLGLEVVVVDHHLLRGEAPRAAALVNPNRPGCGSGQGHLAAAGVTFVLLAALNREARRRGLFAAGGREPDLREWLDLAALGAVCDVTALTGFNRALAAQGLRVMSNWRNPGLRALMQAAGQDVAAGAIRADVFRAGFVLGPRINAGGRIGRSDLGARLLSTDDPEEARQLAEELDALNVSRKEVERLVTEEAARQLDRGASADAPVLVAAGEGWHPGVVGIVAGRLRERYRKPVVVIGLDAVAGVGKGSGRSQAGVNLGRAIGAAFDAGLLLAGGGHAMAAGLTVRPDQLQPFTAFLENTLAAEQGRAAEADALELDAVVTCGGAHRDLWTELQRLTPFGPGNPEPVFAAASVRVEHAQAVRGGHVRATVTDTTGTKLRAVAWRAEETELGRRLLARDGGLHLAGRLKPDNWQGRSGVEFEIEDAADPRRA
jgi:single-stranded-DNA-specific exonuclease